MSIKVRATQLGYFGLVRRKPGQEFEIQSESEFSKRWMARVGEEHEPARPESGELSSAPDEEPVKRGPGRPRKAWI